MSILDELMERKDLGVYLGLRLKELKEGEYATVTGTLKSKRDAVSHQIKGRIRELRRLRHLLAQREIKEESKKIWERLQ